MPSRRPALNSTVKDVIVEIEIPDLARLAGPVETPEEINANGMYRARILDLGFEAGDRIDEGELFALISNAFGTYEIVAPASGRIAEVRREEGDTVVSETVLATIEVDE